MANDVMTSCAQYRRDGFSRVSQLVPREQVHTLMRKVHAVFRRRLETARLPYELGPDDLLTSASLYRLFEQDRSGYIGCMKAIQNLPEVFTMGTSEPMLECVRELGLREPAFSTKPIIMFHSRHTATSEGYWRTPAHQDWRSIQGSLNCLVVWLALVDVTDERGPIQVVRGSHRWGLLDAEADDWYMHVRDERMRQPDYITVPMSAGDGLLFSAFLLHRSGTNRSEDIRCSLQFRFNDLAEPSYVSRGFPDPYTYSPGRDLITPDFPTHEDLATTFGP